MFPQNVFAIQRYCKKDYSKDEVNVVEIIQIRLQKLKKNVVMTSFYCLVSKIWEKNIILCCFKQEKTPGLCCFLNAKK